MSGPNGVEPEVSGGAMLFSAGPAQLDAPARTAAIVANDAIASWRQEVNVPGTEPLQKSSLEL
jgi:hypothetical protein